MSHDTDLSSVPVAAVERRETSSILSPNRRQFLQHSSIVGAAGLTASAGLLSLSTGAYAAVKVGFIPLTDCAPIVMASVLGLDKKIWHHHRSV